MSFRTDIPRICIICGNEYIPRSPKQEACPEPECKKARNRRTSLAYYNKNRDLILKDQEARQHRNITQKTPVAAHHRGSRKEELRDCKCPMCKSIHQVMMSYRPSIRPWIYCADCQPMVESRAFAAVAVDQAVDLLRALSADGGAQSLCRLMWRRRILWGT